MAVGSLGNERRITHVAPGINGTDAVNLNQLHTRIQINRHYLKHYAERGIATALAMPSVPRLQVGRKWVGLGTGHYGSAQAVGVVFAYQATNHVNIGGGMSRATGGGSEFGAKAQVGFVW